MSRSTEVTARVEEAIVEGLDDWVQLHNVVWYCRLAEPEGDYRSLVRALVEELILGGLMVPGDLGETGFEPWTTAPEESVRRVMEQCETYGWNPQGDGAWFAITDAGKVLARSVVQANATP